VPNQPDMSEPVTRAILREELANYPTKAELKAELKAALANYPTMEFLAQAFEAWANTIITLLRGEMRAMEARLQDNVSRDVANAVKVAIEENRRNLSFLDDKYKDVPPRVTRLEAKVFAPKRRKR
jgi:hypothetical protein